MRNKLPLENYYSLWIVGLILLLAALACKAALPETSEQASGEVLFTDDFSDPDSGWNRVSTPTGETDYDDGVYRIFINEANTDIWSKPGLKFEDAIIEVDAFKVGGDRDNRFGIICRATGTDSFYTFIVSSDGFYGIGKVKDNNYKLIGSEALLPHEAINKGSAFNRIRAECISEDLRLSVNGVLVGEVQDSELASGDVGLIAGTYTTPGTDIRFDNFMVLKP